MNGSLYTEIEFLTKYRAEKLIFKWIMKTFNDYNSDNTHRD